MLASFDGSARFTGRAGYYAQNRPGYPAEVINWLKREAGLKPSSIVADVGSGTGISSQLFLQNGNFVFAIEPNSDMRKVAEAALESHAGFRSIQGKAEATTLPSSSVDFVVCAQAFHWFDIEASRIEFLRILKQYGSVVLMWNKRRDDSSSFMRGYEEILRQYGGDYETRWRKQRGGIEESVRRFFQSTPFRAVSIENLQKIDLSRLKHGFLSASYAPLPGDPAHESAVIRLESLFERYANAGTVIFEIDTQVYVGRLQ